MGELNSRRLVENQVCCRYTNGPSLTRQDSNLNRLNQNQQCYRLHHGSSVRTEGFEPPCARRQLVYSQPRHSRVAAHAWLPRQESNLQPTP